MAQIFPSLIAADPLTLGATINLLDPYVSGYHLDIMDFHFVPNLTIGPDIVHAVRKATNKPLLIHLMVDYPERYLDRLRLQKGDVVAIHAESRSDLSLSKLINTLRSLGWTPSLALNPETDVFIATTISVPLEHLLLMSVNPGFSGQTLMPMIYDKITQVHSLGHSYTLAIDGGVNADNAPQLVAAGADQLVIGSALFKTPDPVATLQAIQKSLS